MNLGYCVAFNASNTNIILSFNTLLAISKQYGFISINFNRKYISEESCKSNLGSNLLKSIGTSFPDFNIIRRLSFILSIE